MEQFARLITADLIATIQAVKKNQIESYLVTIYPELYDFAFALIPEDLQAEQMVIDAVCVLMINDAGMLNTFGDKALGGQELYFKVQRQMYKHLFTLGQKRSEQMTNGMKGQSTHPDFFQMDLPSRAVLFLKHKTTLDIGDLEYITDLERSEVLGRLNLARECMCQWIGTKLFEEKVYVE